MKKPENYSAIIELGIDLDALVESIEQAKEKALTSFEKLPVALLMPTWLSTPLALERQRTMRSAGAPGKTGVTHLLLAGKFYPISATMSGLPLVFTNDVEAATALLTDINAMPIETKAAFPLEIRAKSVQS